ncbi:hypothetical protein NLO85_19490 [Pseudomonas savastanoi]|uniref:Uncharacterized protein n=1 Tax=Pseudomonas savastanoi TaxID=29438 RepID=A0AAW5J6N6_PSESS|nr:hypothetical protein [Pseudomonas savastanoi]MCQ3022699.1 hypothetical protein [Pseudomonas savastanoi]
MLISSTDEEWDELVPENFDTTALLRAVDAVDVLREDLNWAACGCKLWDFEIGYHSRNRVDPSSAQAYTWRQRPKNVNGRAGQKPRQSRPVSNAPGILPSCPIPTFPSISVTICNRNGLDLQSSRFSTGIDCVYTSQQTGIICE